MKLSLRKNSECDIFEEIIDQTKIRMIHRLDNYGLRVMTDCE